MANAQAGQASCEEVLDVDIKWPYLPITPTYDEYVQRYVVMPQTERDGFHVKTRSAMKDLLEDVTRGVRWDKRKKRMLFKFRVDLWRRAHNLPQDRAIRAGLGAARSHRLEYTNQLCKYAWSDANVTQRQFEDCLRSRARRQYL
jgi:hypothetical protein